MDIAKAALKRRPDIQLYATLYTPAALDENEQRRLRRRRGAGHAQSRAWNSSSAAYIWGFLAHMQKNGVPIQYLSIANEPDWPHTQPGYCLTPAQYAALLKIVGVYLDKMVRRFPQVPRPKLVAPNTLRRRAPPRIICRPCSRASGTST